MRYVILRDDDTNAFTPVDCLDRLYSPFIERGLPVNLSVIPDVAVDATTPAGDREGFLWQTEAVRESTAPIGTHAELVEYLRARPEFHILQHGCHHQCFEFATDSRSELSGRISRGTRCLLDAGFPVPETFVAPHDRFSPIAFEEVSRAFRVVSTGWFELARLPRAWWPKYLVKKVRCTPHWRVNGTLLLSHPGCLLSRQRRAEEISREVISVLERNQLTVLVTHWWEYFREGRPDEALIGVLHNLADYLASLSGVRVITFRHLIEQSIPLR